MKKSSKRRINQALTLIEMVLSFGLTAILMSSLLFLGSYMWKSSKELKLKREALLSDELLVTRLQDYVGRIYAVSLASSEKINIANRSLVFGCEGDAQEIFFTFGLLAEDNPDFGFVRLGHLFVKDEKLCFEIKASPLTATESMLNTPSEEQIWLEDVEGLRIKFLYVPPLEMLQKSLAVENLTADQLPKFPESGWNERWLRQWESIPTAIAFEITQKERTLTIPVWISKSPLAHYLSRVESDPSQDSDLNESNHETAPEENLSETSEDKP